MHSETTQLNPINHVDGLYFVRLWDITHTMGYYTSRSTSNIQDGLAVPLLQDASQETFKALSPVTGVLPKLGRLSISILINDSV